MQTERFELLQYGKCNFLIYTKLPIFVCLLISLFEWKTQINESKYLHFIWIQFNLIYKQFNKIKPIIYNSICKGNTCEYMQCL